MDLFFSIKIFQKVVELNSFSQAGERLDLSTAMTSKYIKGLEEHLGVRLLNRTSRKISLTNEGKIYYERCSEILNELEDVESALKSTSVTPSGLLRITIPSWFGFRKFTEGISKYSEKYPNVTVEILLNDKLYDLVEENIDLALRVVYDPQSSLIAKRICEVKFFIVASKEYLNKYVTPQNILDLKKHKFITQNHTKQKNILYYKENNQIKNIDLNPSLITDNTIFSLESSLSGMGLAFVPEYLINQEHLKDKVEIVLPDVTFPEHYLFAVYSSKRFLSPKVRTFIDFISDWMKC
ncbi:MAG: LysR family transcriptional regulator [Candidatus Sericytochromatia bacterium]